MTIRELLRQLGQVARESREKARLCILCRDGAGAEQHAAVADALEASMARWRKGIVIIDKCARKNCVERTKPGSSFCRSHDGRRDNVSASLDNLPVVSDAN